MQGNTRKKVGGGGGWKWGKTGIISTSCYLSYSIESEGKHSVISYNRVLVLTMIQQNFILNTLEENESKFTLYVFVVPPDHPLRF